MRFTNKLLLLLLISFSMLFSACGKKDHTEAAKSETQVVAKVNGDEILINQVNFQLARMGQLNEVQSKDAAKQILARLVDQQLLKQQALDAKLDRDPRVLQALESSKNEILAQAFLEQLMTKATLPSASEVDAFYKEHPELFDNRRVFRLQELVVAADKGKFAEIENNLKSIKGINEIATWLKNNNYIFTANSNVRAAEQLPLDFLRKLQPLKDGEVMFMPTDRTFNIIHIAASQSAPINREKAKPIIEQYFVNQNKTNLAKKEMLALNDKAKIEFVGAFSEMKKQDLIKPITASSVSPSHNDKTLSQSGKADIDSPNQTQAKSKTAAGTEQSNMDKGLSGL